jgi:hypothetical protein
MVAGKMFDVQDIKKATSYHCLAFTDCSKLTTLPFSGATKTPKLVFAHKIITTSLDMTHVNQKFQFIGCTHLRLINANG